MKNNKIYDYMISETEGVKTKNEKWFKLFQLNNRDQVFTNILFDTDNIDEACEIFKDHFELIKIQF